MYGAGLMFFSARFLCHACFNKQKHRLSRRCFWYLLRRGSAPARAATRIPSDAGASISRASRKRHVDIGPRSGRIGARAAPARPDEYGEKDDQDNDDDRNDPARGRAVRRGPARSVYHRNHKIFLLLKVIQTWKRRSL